MSNPNPPGTAVQQRPEGATAAGSERGERAVARTQTIERDLLALGTTPQERAVAYAAASHLRQNEMIRAAAIAVAGSSWGENLSQAAQAGIARIALEVGANPVSHINILGSKIYINAEYYVDRATAEQDYNGFDVVNINDDERAKPEERERRKEQRVKHNTPEDPKGIAVVTIHRIGKPDVTAWNHAGNRNGFNAKTGAIGIIKDPIGEQDPGKTSFTRAFRRAAKLCWPVWFARHPILEAEDGVDMKTMLASVEGVIEQGREAIKRGEAASPAQLSPAQVQPDLKVGAGSGGAVKVPAEPFAPEPATAAEQQQQATVDSEIDKLKAELQDLIKPGGHQSITDEDRQFFARVLTARVPTIPQLRQWIDSIKKRIAEWDAGSAAE